MIASEKKPKCSTSKCLEAMFQYKHLPSKQGSDGSRGAIWTWVQPTLILPTKKKVVSRCNQPFIPGSGRESLTDLGPTYLIHRCGKPVLPIRIRWMEISLPSTRAPAVAPDTLILVQPSQVRKFTTWFHNMIPWFGVHVCVCHCQCICCITTFIYFIFITLITFMILILILIIFDSLPSIRGGLNSLCPFFIVLLKSLWNKNETIRHSHQLEWNLHVKLQLRSHLTPRCAVEGVGGEAWMPCQKMWQKGWMDWCEKTHTR